MKKSLTRQERLRSTAEIKSLFRSGKRTESRGIKLFAAPNGITLSRMAVVIGRGCGGAVRRNREKRITREAYRDMKGGLRSGNDLLLVIGRFGQSYRQRRESLSQLFSRAGLCRTRP